jgi:hypothetical protein
MSEKSDIWKEAVKGFVKGAVYVEGEPSNCTTPALNVVSLYVPDPNCFIHVHITKSGKEFIYDYEARTTIRGFWKKYHLSIFKWILGVAGTVLGHI